MKKTSLFFPGILFLVLLFSFRSDKPAYVIFHSNGKAANYEDLLKEALESDLVFFGEIHNNPICHWLEYELTRDLFKARKTDLVLGAEMFETDNQLLLKEYTSGMIRKKDFEAEAKLWPNYKSDYAALVDFARENGLKFIATNVPRRYAAIVNQKGFEGLDTIYAIQRGLIAPLPIKYDSTLECYASITNATGAGNMHASPNIAKAQALKDATMAWFILKNGQEQKTLFLHFNGAYHSDRYQGIVWYVKDYLRRSNIPVKILTITCLEQEKTDELETQNKECADFIICIPSSMTRGG